MIGEAGRAPGRRLAGLLLARRHMQAEAEELADAEPRGVDRRGDLGIVGQGRARREDDEDERDEGRKEHGRCGAEARPGGATGPRCASLRGPAWTPSGRTPCAPAHLSAIPRTRCLAAAFFAASCCTVGALSS